MDSLPGRQRLPLDARIEHASNGWSVHLPVRAEEVIVDKKVVVAEEVLVGIKPVPEVAQVTGTVRREELHVETEGHLEETRPLRVDEVVEIEHRQGQPGANRVDR